MMNLKNVLSERGWFILSCWYCKLLHHFDKAFWWCLFVMRYGNFARKQRSLIKNLYKHPNFNLKLLSEIVLNPHSLKNWRLIHRFMKNKPINWKTQNRRNLRENNKIQSAVNLTRNYQNQGFIHKVRTLGKGEGWSS